MMATAPPGSLTLPLRRFRRDPERGRDEFETLLGDDGFLPE
jgi:hypothetical protein